MKKINNQKLILIFPFLFFFTFVGNAQYEVRYGLAFGKTSTLHYNLRNIGREGVGTSFNTYFEVGSRNFFYRLRYTDYFKGSFDSEIKNEIEDIATVGLEMGYRIKFKKIPFLEIPVAFFQEGGFTEFKDSEVIYSGGMIGLAGGLNFKVNKFIFISAEYFHSKRFFASDLKRGIFGQQRFSLGLSFKLSKLKKKAAAQ